MYPCHSRWRVLFTRKRKLPSLSEREISPIYLIAFSLTHKAGVSVKSHQIKVLS